MIRTQIYLPEDLKSELELIAKRERKPVAEVVRRAVKREVKRKGLTGGATLLKIAAYAGKGPADLSTNLFDYLYGEKSDYSEKATRKRAKWYKDYVEQQKKKAEVSE